MSFDLGRILSGSASLKLRRMHARCLWCTDVYFTYFEQEVKLGHIKRQVLRPACKTCEGFVLIYILSTPLLGNAPFSSLSFRIINWLILTVLIISPVTLSR